MYSRNDVNFEFLAQNIDVYFQFDCDFHFVKLHLYPELYTSKFTCNQLLHNSDVENILGKTYTFIDDQPTYFCMQIN